jgi:hypothetical protein
MHIQENQTERANFHAAKKDGKKPNAAKQSFVQLSKKLDKHENAIKKQSANGKEPCRSNSDSNLE